MAGPNYLTPSQFHAFIKALLRKGSMKWPPRTTCLVRARVSRGMYRCADCKKVVPVSIKGENGKRVHNIAVDHINPVIPVTGFDSWDNVINRMFCDEEGLQVLCKECHDKKCNDERKQRVGKSS